MQLSDIRLRRVIRKIVRPPNKQDMDPRSLAFLRLVLADKSRSLLFVSFPRSGWNRTLDTVGYVLAKHFLGTYDVEYDESAETLKRAEIKPFRWCTPADSRTSTLGNQRLRDLFPAIDVDYCLHSHGYWKHSPLWGLDSARTIFVVRRIPVSLYSYYRSRIHLYDSFEECLADGVLDRAIRFYNSWGEFTRRPESRYAIYRFEDYHTDPVGTFHTLIQDTFGIAVERGIVEEAVGYYSIEKQKEREYRYTRQESKHFHFQGASNYEHLIEPETLEHVHARLRAELVEDFGYDYSDASPDPEEVPSLKVEGEGR